MWYLFLQPSLPQAVNSFHGSRLPCTFWKSILFLWKQAGCQGDRDEREAGCTAWFWHAQGMEASSPMDASPKALGKTKPQGCSHWFFAPKSFCGPLEDRYEAGPGSVRMCRGGSVHMAHLPTARAWPHGSCQHRGCGSGVGHGLWCLVM